MNKGELVKAISNSTGIRQADVDAVIKAIPDVIKTTVKSGEKVSIAGFINFEEKIIPAKTGVSKLGGVEKEWSSPEHSVIKATLSKSYSNFDKG